MKTKIIVLGLVLASQAMAAVPAYELISVPHEELDQFLVPGTDATGTPEPLQGLWWMDGNPLPDEVISFAGAKWETLYEDGAVVGHQTKIPVYDSGIWSWHDSIQGRLLYAGANLVELVYVITFNSDFTFGRAKPEFKLGLLPSIVIPASMLVDFTVVKISEDEYRRDTVLLGQKSSYRFRRLVTAEGERLANWEEFLSKVEAPNALLPICTNNVNFLPPSSCAK